MKMRNNLLGLALVGAIAAWFVSGTIGSGQPAPRAQEAIRAWEYGRLMMMASIKSFSWDTRTAGKRVEAKNMGDLYRKIGGQGALPDGGIVAFYNVLGTQGWEFVAHKEFKERSGRQIFTDVLFKRPKR